ncbi:hypothetical protein [Metabacillus iocasae]|uniref:SWIM-type domain-containing protein n=1 Tax=Priestia iocasae TaxID=2291674 RepID=A0ABS2QX67_9BACI|nr:hypothetical protein [Metabacillus iocasae]MBM7704012.1 hypothetical protein [Metabacillus iocasae]
MNDSIAKTEEQFLRLFSYEDSSVREAAQKGLQFYRLSHVKESEALQRTFVDNEQVHMDEKNLKQSTCSCGRANPCEHFFATFFHKYARQQDLMTLIHTWKSQSTPSVSLSTLNVSPSQTHTHSYKSWKKAFTHQYETFIQHQLNVDFTIYEKLYHHYFQKLQSQAPSASPLRELYTVYSGVETFFKMSLCMQSQEMTSHRLDSFVRPYIYQLLEQIDSQLSQLKKEQLSPYKTSILSASISDIRELLQLSIPLPYEKVELYQMMWTTLYQDSTWMRNEQKELQENSLEQTIARAHLLFLQKQDTKTIEQIRHQPIATFLPAMKWATTVVMNEDKKRAPQWMDYIERHMNGYVRSLSSYQGSRNMVSMMLTLFESYDEAAYIRALRRLLPYSFIEYSRFLYERGDLKQWIEMQAAFRYNILEYEKEALATIKQDHKEWLLPIYHQSIHSLIEQRNRKSYEEAVHHLHELKTLYHALQQEDEYKTYVEKLTTSTKSLRAFQQALQKGQLIHV